MVRGKVALRQTTTQQRRKTQNIDKRRKAQQSSTRKNCDGGKQLKTDGSMEVKVTPRPAAVGSREGRSAACTPLSIMYCLDVYSLIGQMCCVEHMYRLMHLHCFN